MITIILHNQGNKEIKGPRRVREILKELNILENTVLVARGEDLLTPDEIVHDGETIEIIPAISGGSLEVQGL
ncbi:MAG: thiamine biosynthesis protein ThiS [Nitrospirae bacterium]|nr:MAG: thiamine biosynthesis protein ThiS [Nitrospirota bacterium]